MSNRASDKSLQKRIDIFPSTFSDDIRPLDDEPDFQSYSSSYKLFPLEMYINESPIASTSWSGKPPKLPKVYYDEVYCSVRLQNHFRNVSNKITDSKPNEKLKHWSHVHKKLLDANAKQFRNTNQRTCFMFERNHFLVPHAFTFGVRTVARGTGHFYMTHNIPLEFYQLQSPYKNRIHATTRLFDPTHQNAYYHKQMQPHTCYWVPSGTTYIVTCLEPAYFAVHLVHSGFRPKFEYKNPLHEKKKSVPHGVRPLTMETPNVADERFERFVPSDPILLAFESGQEMRMSSLSSPPPVKPSDPILLAFESGQELRMSSLSSPPPADPPPPPPVVTVEIKQIPMERAVQVVAPEVVRWYADMFQYKMYDNPRQVFEYGRSEQAEPVDLCLPKKTPAAEEQHLEDADDFSKVNATVTEKTSEMDTIITTNTMTAEEYQNVLNSLKEIEAASNWRKKPVETVYLEQYDPSTEIYF